MRFMPLGPVHDTPRTRSRLSVVEASRDAQQSVHIGAAFRARRQAVGMTQERAAASAGITRNALMNIERSAFPNPTLSTLLSLMRTYGLRTLDELLGPTSAEAAAEAWSGLEWAGGVPKPVPR